MEMVEIVRPIECFPTTFPVEASIHVSRPTPSPMLRVLAYNNILYLYRGLVFQSIHLVQVAWHREPFYRFYRFCSVVHCNRLSTWEETGRNRLHPFGSALGIHSKKPSVPPQIKISSFFTTP